VGWAAEAAGELYASVPTAGASASAAMARRAELAHNVKIVDARDVVSEMEKVRRVLLDNKSSEWEKRIKALRRCRSLASTVAESADSSLLEAFVSVLRTVKRPLAAQVNDLRSSVVREACECLGSVAESLGDLFGEALGDEVVPALLKTSAVTIQIVSDSGAEATRRVLNSSKLPAQVLVGLMLHAGHRSALATRGAVAEFLGIVLERHPKSEIDRCVVQVEASLRHGLSDPHAEIRRQSRRNFCHYRLTYGDRAHLLYMSLDAATQRSITEEKSDVELASRARDRARRQSMAFPPQRVDAGMSHGLSKKSPQCPGGVSSAPRHQLLSRRARRITSSVQPDVPSGGAASRAHHMAMTPSKPGRVAVAGPRTVPKQLKDWSARVAALKDVVSTGKGGDAQAFEEAVKTVGECLTDTHVKVVVESLYGLAELFSGNSGVGSVLEKQLGLLARVLLRRTSSNQAVREGAAAVLLTVSEEVSADGRTSALIKLLTACSIGKVFIEGGVDRALPSILAYLDEILQESKTDDFEWRAAILEGAIRTLAPLSRGRSCEVRKCASEALRSLSQLAPPGAFYLATETMDLSMRSIVRGIVPTCVTPEGCSDVENDEANTPEDRSPALPHCVTEAASQTAVGESSCGTPTPLAFEREISRPADSPGVAQREQEDELETLRRQVCDENVEISSLKQQLQNVLSRGFISANLSRVSHFLKGCITDLRACSASSVPPFAVKMTIEHTVRASGRPEEVAKTCFEAFDLSVAHATPAAVALRGSCQALASIRGSDDISGIIKPWMTKTVNAMRHPAAAVRLAAVCLLAHAQQRTVLIPTSYSTTRHNYPRESL